MNRIDLPSGDHTGLRFTTLPGSTTATLPLSTSTTLSGDDERLSRLGGIPSTNASLAPFGDHASECSVAPDTTRRASPPLICLTKIPSKFAYAMRDPSGDHTTSVIGDSGV